MVLGDGAYTQTGSLFGSSSALATVELENIESAIQEAIRYLTWIKVSRIDESSSSVLSSHRYLQGNDDVHGSHIFFYWTRCRGHGLIVSSSRAAVLLYFSPEMNSVTLVRPVGDLEGISELLNDVVGIVKEVVPGKRIVVRYCGIALTSKLKSNGWVDLQSQLLKGAYLDDETWPEIIIDAPPQEIPSGPDFRKVRKAIHRNSGKYSYVSSRSLLGLNEFEFISKLSARADTESEYEDSFNESIERFFLKFEDYGLHFHYLFSGKNIVGFNISGRNTHITHSYYSGVRKEAGLSTFFRWHIYLNERMEGAQALNLGGSESDSLYSYKAKTFPIHIMGITQPLEKN